MDQQDDTIQIPFRKRIEVGETKFSLDIPRYKIDDEAYTFEFESLRLVPEYYSQQAQLLDFDSEAENNFLVENPFQFEFTFTGDYYDKTNDNNKWSLSATDKDVSSILKSLNAFFDKVKPAGSVYPPATFDWVGTTFYDSGASIADFHQMAADSLYNEVYDPAKHDHFLPAGHRRESVNNMIFPSVLDFAIMKKMVHIRLTLAPNVKLGFSNDKLLVALGFFDGQFQQKTYTSGQVTITNTSSTFKVYDGYVGIGDVKEAAGAKMTLYQFDPKLQVSTIGMFITPRGELKLIDKLAKRYIENVKKLSLHCNQKVSLEYTKATKTFKFVFPDNPVVDTVVTLPAAMSNQLGYGREVTRITKDMVTQAKPQEFGGLVLSELERSSRTVVYDIGLAIVLLEDTFSNQTVLFQNKVMAVLEPIFDGTMTINHRGNPSTKVYASSFAVPRMTFILSRFSEDMKPMPIALPCGAYIQGSLVGKRIKRAK